MRKQLLRSFYVLAILLGCCYYKGQAQWQVYGNRNSTDSMKLGTIEPKPIRIITGNENRMIIDAAGRVGIGTLLPTHTLHVNGQLKIVDGTQGAGKVLTSDADGLGSWLTPATSPWIPSGNDLYNINTGNVGIGLLTPLFKLDVNGDIRANGIRMGKGRNSLADNTAIGVGTLDSITMGLGNTANGFNALNQNKTGNRNSAVGVNALSKNTSGTENTATGAGALQANTTGNNNTAIGANALNKNTTGRNNIAIGDSALFANTTGSFNTVTGNFSTRNNLTGDSNTAYGYQVMMLNTSGRNNTAVGYKALLNNKTGSSITTIGMGADVLDSINTYINATAIGANAKVGQSNSLVLGSGANVGIGTATPSTRLHVNNATAGAIRIVDGTQAAGKVLTSDASGVGSWLLAPGSMWTTNNAPNTSFSQSGNVGIGTASPTNKLDVTGNGIRVLSGAAGTGTGVTIGRTTNEANFAIASVANQWATGAVAGDAVLRNGGGGKLFLQADSAKPHVAIDTNGNVGIGKINPQARLDVNGDIRLSGGTLPMSMTRDTTGTADSSVAFTLGMNFREADKNPIYSGGGYRLFSRVTTPKLPLHQWYSRKANSPVDDLVMSLNQNGGLAIGSTFATGNNAPLNGAIIQGSVGIGTNTPTTMLDVRRLDNATSNDAIAFGSKTYYMGRLGESSTENGIYLANMYGFNNPFIDFRVEGNALVNTKMRIMGNGNVGIGITNPTAKLEISNFSNQTAFRVYGNAATVMSVGSVGEVKVDAPNIEGGRLIIKDNGNVGIGNTSPGHRLSVSGTTFCTSGAWSGSDMRYKKNVQTIGNALQRVLQLRGVTYNFKTEEFPKLNFDKDKQIGVIAQELEKVFPELVKTDNEGYKAVSYEKMAPILIEAMKEQQAQINNKDQVIANQQEQIKSLQAQVNLQQSQINTVLSRLDGLQSKQEACCTAAAAKTTVSDQVTTLSSASLEQNIPNPPVNHATRIGYNIPRGTKKAELVINDNTGRKIKSINLTITGKGNLNVDTRDLTPGTYAYTLLVDGRMVETKQMVVAGSN